MHGPTRPARRRLTAPAALAWSILALLTMPAALGQAFRPPPGFHEAMRPEVLRRDLPLFVQMLSLDRDQAVILQELFQEYDRAHRDGAEALRRSMMATTRRFEGPQEAVMEDFRRRMTAVIQDYRREIEKLPEGADPAPLKADLEQRLTALRQGLRDDRESLDQGTTAPKRRDDDLAAELAAWEARRQALRTSFFEGVRAILNQHQLVAYPALERALVRSRSMRAGRLAGESTDLVELVRALDLPEPIAQSLAPTLEGYEIALHEALLDRERILLETRSPLAAAEQAGDAASALKLVDRQISARLVVREVNDRFVPLLSDELPEEPRERFARLVRQRSYPRVYQPTRAERVFLVAVEMSDLDPEFAESVRSLRQAYRQELEPVNERLVAVLRDHEPARARYHLERRLAARAGQRPAAGDDPVRSAFQGRVELDRRYMEALLGMLTPEQAARLPDHELRRAEEQKRARRQ